MAGDGVKVGTGYIQIMPEMKDFTQAVKSETGKSLEQAGESGGSSLGAGLKKGVRIATAAVTAAAGAITAFGGSSVKAGMDFDASMSQVAATMGTTTDQIGDLREFAQEMGRTTAFSATEAADALNYMALAGYDAETSMNMLPTVLNLAAAGGIDLASASDMVTDAQSALGLSIDETSDLVDKMAKASSKSNTSVAQLGDAILKIGGTANVMSGGTTELATSLGILADNGIKGAEGGTHLRNILLSLAAPTDTAAAYLDALGVKAVDAEGNMRPLEDIMLDLNDSLEGMGAAEKAEIISKIFNKTDISSVNALLGTSKKRWEELAGAIDDSAGAAEAMANTQLDNLAGDITLFQSALEGAKIAISDQLTPTLREFVQFGTDAISDMTAAFNEDGLAGAMGVLGDYISQAMQKIIDSLPTMVDGAVQLLGSLLEGIADNIPQIAETAVAVITKLIEGFADMLPDLIRAATTLATEVVQALVTNLPEILAALWDGIKAGFEAMSENFEGVGIILGGALMAKFGPTAIQALTGSGGALSGIAEKITEAMGGSGVIGIALAGLGVAIAGAITAGTALGQSVLDGWIETELGSSIQEAKNAISGLTDEFGNITGEYEKTLEELSKDRSDSYTLLAWLEDAINEKNPSEALKQQIQSVVDELNEKWPELGLQYDELTGHLNMQNKEIQKNIDLFYEQARSAAAIQFATEALQNLASTRTELGELKTNFQGLLDEMNLNTPEGTKAVGEFAISMQNLMNSGHPAADALRMLIDAGNEGNPVLAALAEVAGPFGANLEEAASKALGLVDGMTSLTASTVGYEEEAAKSVAMLQELGYSEEQARAMLGLTTGALADSTQAANINAEAITALAARYGTDIPNSLQIAVDQATEAGIAIPAEIANGIADGSYDVDAAIQAIMDLLNRTDEASENAEATGEIYPEVIADSIEGGTGQIEAATDAVIDTLDVSDESGETGTDVGESFNENLAATAEGSAQAAEEVKNAVTSTIDPLSGEMGESGSESGSELNQGFGDWKGTIEGTVEETYNYFLHFFSEILPPMMSTWGSAAGMNLNQGLNNYVPDIQTTVSNIVNDIDSGLSVLPGYTEAAGYDGGAGLYNGLAEWEGALYSLASSIAWNISSTIRAAFNSHSPSRVMMAIGEDVGEGLAIGITDGGDLAITAAEDVSYDIIDAASHYDYGQIEAAQTSDESQLDQIIDLLNDLRNLKVVMDSGEVVGVLAPELSDEFERMKIRQGRG